MSCAYAVLFLLAVRARARVCVCEYVSVFVCLHRYLTKRQASLTLQDSASAINGTDWY